MNTYETLLHLAIEPYDKKLKLRYELNSSEAIFNELKKELTNSSSHGEYLVRNRQASETMVYKN